MEALEAEFLKTDYLRIDDSIGDSVIVYTEEGDLRSRDALRDSEGAAWTKLLAAAGVMYVSRYGEDTEFGILVRHRESGSSDAWYVHDRSGRKKPTECRDEFADLACGICGITLDERWWVHIGWFDFPYDKEAEAMYMDGEISIEEYEKRSRDGYQKCIEEGWEALGYPPPEPLPDW